MNKTVFEARDFSKKNYGITINANNVILMPNGRKSSLSLSVKGSRILIHDLTDANKCIFMCSKVELLGQFFENKWFLNKIC